jgi:CheY-like chemotaxis protein
VDPDLVARVPGQVLREVLVNLFLNALEAMPERGGLTVSAAARDDRVVLTVADEGPGLAPEDAERIFAPGATGHDDPARGTGLAGCRQLLAAVGGRLSFVPDAGPGAVFELDLPAGTPPARTEPAAEPLVAGAAPAVLVIDDEPPVRAMLVDLLGEMGCRVSGARSLRTGREVFAAESFDVVLLDVSLPDGSGLDLAAELRRLDPAVALVAMTGLDREAALAGADRHGVDLEAVKPLTWDGIRDIVNRGAALAEARRRTGETR